MTRPHSTTQSLLHSFFKKLQHSIGKPPLPTVLCVLSLTGYLSLTELRTFLDLLFTQSERYSAPLELVVYGGPLNGEPQRLTRDSYSTVLDSIQLIGGFSVDMKDDLHHALQSVPLQGEDLSGLLILIEAPFEPLPSGTLPAHLDLCVIQYENHQFKPVA